MSNHTMLNKSTLHKKLASSDTQIVIQTILNMVFNSKVDDLEWISNQLIALIHHDNQDIRRLATLCFGHLARLHGELGNYDEVVTLLRTLTKDEDIGGTAQDALDDIDIFLR